MSPGARSAYPVLALLALIVIAPLAGLAGLGALPGFESADLQFWRSGYIRRALQFSLWQAGLSTLLSVLPAILVARALFYCGDFPLRGMLLRLFAVPLVVPSVVAVLGIVSVYGGDGWIPLGRSLYGLNGILLAHVFFNLPLAVRLLLPLWQAVPRHHWQLGEQLGFDTRQRFRLIEWPVLREGLPGVMLLVFMLCLTSFAVVLTLGGGPRSTTLEVAIYQSLRLDFDPRQAVVLALLQLALCALVAFFTLRLQRLPEVEITLSLSSRPARRSVPRIYFLPVLLAAIYVALPLFSLLLDALRGPLRQVLGSPQLWLAASYSIGIGLAAALLSTLAGWMLLRGSSEFAYRGMTARAKLIETAASIVYVVPPLVLGTGLFVLLSARVNVFDWVFPLVILINALMGLPFVIRTLGPAMRQQYRRDHLLCRSLGVEGWQRWRRIEWPQLRRAAGLSAALVAVLAMGDLGVIALFGTAETTTLPLLLYQQLGAYRIPQAAVSAALLLLLCLLVFGLIERGIGGRRDA